jgi:hypothetical protein
MAAGVHHGLAMRLTRRKSGSSTNLQHYASKSVEMIIRGYIKASTREKLTSVNWQGYDEPIRSAYVRTEVNKIMTQFDQELLSERTGGFP